MSHTLHDWTLIGISVTWETGDVDIVVSWNSKEHRIRARNMAAMSVPRKEEWGPSVSINQVSGPTSGGPGEAKLEIQMQTGDVITIVAESFEMPL